MGTGLFYADRRTDVLRNSASAPDKPFILAWQSISVSHEDYTLVRLYNTETTCFLWGRKLIFMYSLHEFEGLSAALW